jgi:hypothetical protein
LRQSGTVIVTRCHAWHELLDFQQNASAGFTTALAMRKVTRMHRDEVDIWGVLFWLRA